MSNASDMAALYARASTDHQKYSTANQLDALRVYADNHGLKVCRTYVDEGRSGLTLAGRAGLAALLQDILQVPPAFQQLLVYDVSRWGRFQDIDESAYYEHLCKRAGVRLTYVAEPFLAEPGPMASLVKAMKRTMAAEYSRELSVKAFVGHMRLASMGYCQGGAPNYGLSRLLVDGQGGPIQALKPGERKAVKTDRIKLAPGPPHEVAVVRQIFDLFVNQQLTERQIAERLTSAGVQPPLCKTWHPTVISTFLKNERYVGEIIYNRTSIKLKQPRVKNPAAEWVRKAGAHEPIIDVDLFARAQERFAARTQRPIRTKDQLISELRALFLKKGRLSAGLIDREPGMAASFTYVRRFGTLERVYGLVGCPISPRGKGWRRVQGAHEERRKRLAQSLRELLARHGRITKKIIQKEPGFPALSTIVYTFGTLGEAYAYIGYKPPPPGPPPRVRLEGRTILSAWPADASSAD